MQNQEDTVMEKKICNVCGNMVTGDVLDIEKIWGFFSGKDGEIHHFCLCEKCYDKMIKGFAVPVSVEEQTELV